MQLSDMPSKLVLAFASAGIKNTIPVPSQIGVTPGAASYTDGFPPLTMTRPENGGTGVDGLDMNGVLNGLSAVDVWMSAGGGFPYDVAFSAAIGGYPKGARVLMVSGGGYWVSTADNNATNPDTGGAGWAADDSNAINALTGDVTASGPGSALATLAATGVTPGTYSGPFTVDGKGRVTAASSSGSFNVVAMWNGPSGTLVDSGNGGSAWNSGAISWGKTIVGPYQILATTTGWPSGGYVGDVVGWSVVATPIDGSTFSFGVNGAEINHARGHVLPSVTCFAIQ